MHNLGHVVKDPISKTLGRLWPLGLTTPVLEDLPDPIFAVGTRKLRNGYTGQCLRLRRDSDNAESDFGFDANRNLDVAAIVTWLGGANGFIVTWYDQGAGGRNLTESNTTFQPAYIASIQNSRPGIRLDGSNDRLTYSTGFPASALTMVCAFKQTDAVDGVPLAAAWNTVPDKYDLLVGSSGGSLFGQIEGISPAEYAHDINGETTLVTFYATEGLGCTLRSNNVQRDNISEATAWANSLGNNGVQVGQTFPTGWFKGDIYEAYIWNSVLNDTQIAFLEDDINDYWSLY